MDNGNGQRTPKLDYEPQSLKGKRVLITGGTTGIGRAASVLLAAKGARIVTFGRDDQDLKDALTDIQEVGGEVYGITADVTKKEDLQKVFQFVDEKLGGVDILINNAAIGGGSLMNQSYDAWHTMLETNVLGYMAYCHDALTRMEEQGSGHIIFIGSMSAETREPGAEIYNATKAAIQAFSESIRKRENPRGIKVSLIEPGAVGTDMQPTTAAEERQREEEGTMLKAEDIAYAIYYILTQPERSDVISMQIRPLRQAI